MSRGLGKVQKSVLCCLEEHGSWHDAGCGWVWNSVGGTELILQGLERRGLVKSTTRHPKRGEVYRRREGITTYKLTAAGRRELQNI